MKLWEYLREKIKPYSERVAFADSGITYGELLSWGNNAAGEKRLQVCKGGTREEQALAILKCLAEGAAAVPVSLDYGLKQYNYICETVKDAGQVSDDTAFVMFTSGTTGTPKGVVLTDKNIVANLEYIASYFRLEGMKSICIARPLVHIAVLTGELLYGLVRGLTIYFYEESFMPARLAKFLSEKEIDVFCATPTLYAALVRSAKGKPLPVKAAAVSGERLTEAAARQLSEALPQTAFYNVYGLTEHSPRASALLPEEFVKKAGSVGKPIGAVKMKIEKGELLVKSPCVMKGYYLDEARTKEKIRRGWLYTGDMAHTDEEGYYYIDGRKDDMIIRAGVNIFPQEIEIEAKKCAGVHDCVVYGEREEHMGEMICLKYEGSIPSEWLWTYLVRNLPPYLVPNRIKKVEKLETTASGKKIRR